MMRTKLQAILPEVKEMLLQSIPHVSVLDSLFICTFLFPFFLAGDGPTEN